MKLTDQEQVVLKVIRQIGRGGVASVESVISAAGYPKATTKKALESLASKDAIITHRYDHPGSLTPAQRKVMLRLKDGRGQWAYYGAVSLGRKNPMKAKTAKQSKGTTALKTTGRALKGAARGVLAAGSQILGAGAKVLNPKKRKKNASRTVHSVRPSRKKSARTVNKTGHKTVSRKPLASKRKASVKKTNRKAGKRNPAPQILAIVNRTSPKAKANRKEFAGEYRKDTPLYFPEGTPGGLSKLGKLLQIKTNKVVVKPHTQTWLCRDAQGRLHLGTISKDGVIWHGPKQDFGKVVQVDYEDVKKHLGYNKPQGFYHFMGEENGIRPTLYSDGKGGLKFKGGNYRFTSRGIEN